MSLAELLQITWLSLTVSGLAVLLAFLTGLPSAIWLYLREFRGKRFIISLINTGMGLPPVVIGLFIALLFWRNGPLGFLQLIYTPAAMVIAQFIIAFPVVAGLSFVAFEQVEAELLLQARALGASRLQMIKILINESRLGQLAALIAAFGGVISEVGAVMMVGGNLKGYTRVLTTSIVQETRMGNFTAAIYLSLVLLALSFTVNWLLTSIQHRGETKWKRPNWK